MNRQFKIRFNLSRGVHYKQWKLEYDGHVEYLDPDHTQLIMYNCLLHNNKKAAEDIFSGANKRVCAWIRCGGLCIIRDEHLYDNKSSEQLSYNPKLKPFWFYHNENVDGKEFKTIYSYGNQLFSA